MILLFYFEPGSQYGALVDLGLYGLEEAGLQLRQPHLRMPPKWTKYSSGAPHQQSLNAFSILRKRQRKGIKNDWSRLPCGAHPALLEPQETA